MLDYWIGCANKHISVTSMVLEQNGNSKHVAQEKMSLKINVSNLRLQKQNLKGIK